MMPHRCNHVAVIRSSLRVAMIALASTGPSAWAWDTGYLQGLLDSTPAGGWVQVNSTPYSSAWAGPAQGGVSVDSYSDPSAIVRAWSSFAWDSNRGNLILFGGGHANYAGNEVYLWSGETGAWSRGSLPSRVQSVGGVPGAWPSEYVVVDGAAPISMHTYEGNVFLPGIDRMAVMGGAAFNSGGTPRKLVNGELVGTGPWYWDPSKANPNQVGGTTGSGYLSSSVGGEMWTDRSTSVSGAQAGSAIDSSTAYRQENGRDVVYTARMSQGSGWSNLYRFTAGNPAAAESDLWELVATTSYTAKNFQSSGTIDLDNNLYVRTAFQEDGGRYGLGVWDLSRASAAAPGAAKDRFIALEFEDGTPFQTNTNFAIDFDSRNSRLVLWDGSNRGEVFYVDAEYLGNGALDSTWTVMRGMATSVAEPNGGFVNAAGNLGVLGKWQYVPELGAFMALDMYDSSSMDAGVWLYKPLVAAVPEPGAALLMALGGASLLLWSRRRRQAARSAA